MTWAASSSTNAITSGLAVIAMGLFLVVLARSDLGRTARSFLERFYARSMGAAEAQELADRGRRQTAVFHTVLGCACIGAGCVAVVVGLLGAI